MSLCSHEDFALKLPYAGVCKTLVYSFIRARSLAFAFQSSGVSVAVHHALWKILEEKFIFYCGRQRTANILSCQYQYHWYLYW